MSEKLTMPKNVQAFVNKYGRIGSKEQDATFWKEFRKAANAYADVQAKRICDLEHALRCWTTVTAQRDEAREVLKITQEAWVKAKAERVEALRERDEARDENGTWKQIASGRLSKIAEVTAQRDRLAEALRSIKNELGVPQPEYPAPVANAVKIADEALQSLTQKP